jgi:hypothetical protein
LPGLQRLLLSRVFLNQLLGLLLVLLFQSRRIRIHILMFSVLPRLKLLPLLGLPRDQLALLLFVRLVSLCIP